MVLRPSGSLSDQTKQNLLTGTFLAMTYVKENFTIYQLILQLENGALMLSGLFEKRRA